MAKEKVQRKTHPALDFLDGMAMVGIVDTQQRVWRVDSTRQQHSATLLQLQGAFTVAPSNYEGVVGRWDDDLQRFLAGEPGPTCGEVLDNVMGLIKHYIALTQPEEVSLVACWIIGTYFFPLFPTFHG